MFEILRGILGAFGLFDWIGGFFCDREMVRKGRAAERMDAIVQDRDAAVAARKADAVAERVADAASEQVEQDNEQARDAAHGSDDPLGDGLRSLRGSRQQRSAGEAGGAD